MPFRNVSLQRNQKHTSVIEMQNHLGLEVEYPFVMEPNTNSGVPRNFFFGGGVQQIQLRTEGRETGDLGAVAP
jgi:hypothetical protein